MSSPPLRVFLTSEQERTLFELSKAENVPQRTYNSRQILEILATLNQVHLSERHLRRILKKKLLMEKNEKLQ